MNKFIAAGALSVLLFAGVAAAQTYGYSMTACVTVARDLSIGSRGSDVSDLQRFLVAQNYPGGGSWMVTGYFGQATAAAVRNFQQSAGVVPSGVVDGATRAALQARSCGYAQPSSSYNLPAGQAGWMWNSYQVPNNFFGGYNYSPQYNYQSYPYMYNYGYNNNYNFGTVNISSLSLMNAVPGTIITISGTGFDPYNNTIHFGTSALTAASNGNTLQFAVPNIAPGSYQVFVSNSLGTSNSLSFTVRASSNYGCAGYTFGSSYSCGPVTLSYLSPQSGSVGTTVTVFGSGMSGTGNTVHFGVGLIANLSSIDGQSVSFTVPVVLSGYGSQQVQIGNYPVSVTNAQGQTSNTLPFYVSSTAGSMGPKITSVSGPSSLALGVQGTWTITLSAPTGNNVTTSVNWGDQNPYSAAPQTTYSQGTQTLTFTHTYLYAGTYTVTFTVSSVGGTNSSSATVVVGGAQSSTISLTSLSPNVGPVGTLVTVQGNGFTTDNTVLFGNGVAAQGAIAHVNSSNGTTLTFTVPSALNPLCYYFGCMLPSQQTVPGSYWVTVQNQNGTSNAVSFLVQ